MYFLLSGIFLNMQTRTENLKDYHIEQLPFTELKYSVDKIQ